MAEKMIVLMADLDRASQERMAGWYGELRQAGFTGTQTPGLPYHISLAVFAPEEEDAALALTRKAAAEFAPFPVHISHVGIFSPGRVLFGAPENAMSALEDEEMPQPQAFESDYHTHKKGDYAWVIVQMQDVLREQGYLVMDGPTTGYFGDQTEKAVAAYQRDHSLEPTGEADEATQKLILGIES